MTPIEQDEPSDELLFRYVADQCSAMELSAIADWRSRGPHNESRLGEIRRVWSASRAIPTRDLDRMWTRLHVATRAADRSAEVVGPRADRRVNRLDNRRRSTREPSKAVWAAGILTVIGSGVLYLSHARPVQKSNAVGPPHVYATGPAQTATVRLRDGTSVTLAPKSRLVVPADYGTHGRLVSLDGEGFFTVLHDATSRFRVGAKGVVVNDVGTKFDLSAYHDDRGVVVIVADGEVTIGHAHNDIPSTGPEGYVVRRGQRARVSEDDSTVAIDGVSLRLVDWTEGRLAFDSAPLSEIVRTLGRWYQLDVQLDDIALGSRKITADFNRQSPREILDILAASVGGVVRQHGRVLIIQTTP